MQGLHLTGDLFDCGCSAAFLTDLDTLAALCRDATVQAQLTVVDEKFHVFPDVDGQPGGITGALLLAESHLAVHTWPERRGVTLDVYVCNFTSDNCAKAQGLFDTLLVAFRPASQNVNRIERGDLAASIRASAVAARRDAPAPVASDSIIFDWLNANAGYGFTARATLQTLQSPYQRIEVYDTPQFGRLFRLDGRLMTSEGEEFFYHECMTHPAMLTHPDPRSVLVIGGGDGGSSEELFKHPSVRRIVMAELDQAVIDVSKRYLQRIHGGAFGDPRLTVRIGDGFEFVRTTPDRFDLIVLDLTDPDTPAFHLYSEQFFRMCRAILNPGGLLTLHLGSPVYQPSTVRKNAQNLRKVFSQVHPMALYIPLYGSLWCLAVASDSADPRTVGADLIASRMRERGLTDLQYYNAEVHGALFVLPNFVRDLTAGAQAAAGGPPVTRLAA
ncbi:MAG TPA: polyamine aminopropyltransferase [Burkholderiaceae bacterium]|nr:polyamine aminopropyltransferase [Burkholderiaceae bacterium]